MGKILFAKEYLDLPNCDFSLLNSKKRVIKGRVFYNHEFGVEIPQNNNCYKAIDDNFMRFASFYCNKSIVGIQFHPEKASLLD